MVGLQQHSLKMERIRSEGWMEGRTDKITTEWLNRIYKRSKLCISAMVSYNFKILENLPYIDSWWLWYWIVLYWTELHGCGVECYILDWIRSQEERMEKGGSLLRYYSEQGIVSYCLIEEIVCHCIKWTVISCTWKVVLICWNKVLWNYLDALDLNPARCIAKKRLPH